MDKLKIRFMKIVLLHIWKVNDRDAYIRNECKSIINQLNLKLEEEN